jgi:hypothetical protein
MDLSDKIKISMKNKIIKSPKRVNNLSKELKNKLKSPEKLSDKSDKTKDLKLKSSLKKIKLSVSNNRRTNNKNNLFIPTNLSITKDKPVIDVVKDKPVIDVVKPNIVVPVKKEEKRKSSIKKLSKKRVRKSTKNKTISVKLNNKAKKEKDILEIVNKFEKMNIKEIKDFLKTKGITTTNKNKSKLLPYIYLLTCVDDDINIIKK